MAKVRRVARRRRPLVALLVWCFSCTWELCMEKGSVRRVTRLSTTAKVAFTPSRKNFPEASSSQLSLLFEGRTRDAPVREKSIRSAFTPSPTPNPSEIVRRIFDSTCGSVSTLRFKRLRMRTRFAAVSCVCLCVCVCVCVCVVCVCVVCVCCDGVSCARFTSLPARSHVNTIQDGGSTGTNLLRAFR